MAQTELGLYGTSRGGPFGSFAGKEASFQFRRKRGGVILMYRYAVEASIAIMVGFLRWRLS